MSGGLENSWPATRYAVAEDGTHLAYQVVGQGSMDIVLLLTWWSHVEAQWDLPGFSRCVHRLAGHGRVILLDRRGIGMSDPLSPRDLPTVEAWMDDLRVVLDSVGSSRAALVCHGNTGPMAILFAATFPERVGALTLSNTAARWTAASDYPLGARDEVVQTFLDRLESRWGTRRFLEPMNPTLQGDSRLSEQWARYQRMSASPGLARALYEVALRADVRAILGAVRVPTLVVHRSGVSSPTVAAGRYLADHIPDARFVEVPGGDITFLFDDRDPILDEVEEFLTGSRTVGAVDRALATLLFTDIVGSTAEAFRLGDRPWCDRLDAHDAIVRRQLQRFRGTEVKTIGDGFLATFGGPAAAIECARAVVQLAQRIGLQVRAGVHTGEVELRGDDVSGTHVNIAARIAALAQPGEVLVSRTVADLVVGSTIAFVDRGEQDLKGVGPWRLFSVVL